MASAHLKGPTNAWTTRLAAGSVSHEGGRGAGRTPCKAKGHRWASVNLLADQLPPAGPMLVPGYKEMPSQEICSGTNSWAAQMRTKIRAQGRCLQMWARSPGQSRPQDKKISRPLLPFSKRGMDWQKGRRGRKTPPEEMNGRCVTPSSFTLPYSSHRPSRNGK